MRYHMNNQIPFFNPYPNFGGNNINGLNIERLEEKLEKIEKNLNTITTRVKKIEQQINSNSKNDYYSEDPTDMYMI